MISTFKNTVWGGFLVTACWRENIVPKVKNKFTTDENRAVNIIMQMKRDILREKVTKLLNHRSQVMNNFGGLRTENKFKAIETLRNNFAFLADKSLQSNCKLVVDYENLFMELIPGKSSVFHQSTKETIMELIEFCKLEIKVTI